MLSKNISCDFLSARVKNIDCDFLSCDFLSAYQIMHLDVPNLREIIINTLTNMHLGIRKKLRSGFEFPLNVQHVMVNKLIDLKCVYIYIVNQIRQRI